MCTQYWINVNMVWTICEYSVSHRAITFQVVLKPMNEITSAEYTKRQYLISTSTANIKCLNCGAILLNGITLH